MDVGPEKGILVWGKFGRRDEGHFLGWKEYHPIPGSDSDTVSRMNRTTTTHVSRIKYDVLVYPSGCKDLTPIRKHNLRPTTTDLRLSPADSDNNEIVFHLRISVSSHKLYDIIVKKKFKNVEHLRRDIFLGRNYSPVEYLSLVRRHLFLFFFPQKYETSKYCIPGGGTRTVFIGSVSADNFVKRYCKSIFQSNIVFEYVMKMRKMFFFFFWQINFMQRCFNWFIGKIKWIWESFFHFKINAK